MSQLMGGRGGLRARNVLRGVIHIVVYCMCAGWTQASNSVDLNHDGLVDSKDIHALLDRQLGIAAGQPTDDLNGDGRSNVGDAVYLTNLTNRGGPDPAQLAPILPPSASTNFTSATQFLYNGPLAPQAGVEPGTIDRTRAAVVRGRVLNAVGQPLAGVTLQIHHHPEFGTTLSRADGFFDMAINGGGEVAIDYQKNNHLPAQRLVQTDWNDIALAPDVRLIMVDPIVTAIDLASTAPIQLAHSSMIQDVDGTRTGQVIIRSGTQAFMTLPGGTTQTLTTLHVRATEYTIGAGGPETMPAPLPAESGYTYCVELSDDQAQAANANTVTFSQPLYYYLNNFIGFPVGADIPNGYYDREKAQWVAGTNGEVLKVLSITAGKADLDVMGKGQVATTPQLTARNIDDNELRIIASLYPAGSTFWRTPIAHFSPWDHNWPYVPPLDSIPPAQPTPEPDIPKRPKDCKGKGSEIGYRNQTVGERIPLAGMPFGLNYRNDRVPGRSDFYTLKFNLSGTTIPSSLAKIQFDATIGGRRVTQEFDPATNLSHEFHWDGRNVYGQELNGAQRLTYVLHYIYPGQYMTDTSAFEATFARVMGAVGAGSGGGGGGGGGGGSSAFFGFTMMRPTTQIDITQQSTALIGNFNARSVGLGGWTLDVHHAYDPLRQRTYLGTGDFMDARSDIPVIVKTVAGDGRTTSSLADQQASKSSINLPFSLTAGPDGSIYTAEGATDQNTFQKIGYCIRRLGPDGILHVVAGTGTYGFSGDGGPATAAKIGQVDGMAIGSDGSLYFSDSTNYRVRRIWPDGTINTIAGIGSPQPNPTEGILATQASLNPIGLAVAPDGRVFVVDQNNRRASVITTDGRLWTLAGHGGTTSGFGDGGLAYNCILNVPVGIAYGPDGSVYIADGYLRRIRPDGFIEAFAGSFVSSNRFSGDGGLARQAGFQNLSGVVACNDGVVYVQDGNRIRRITQDGIIDTIAGQANLQSPLGDGGPAMDGGFSLFINGLAQGADKSLYVADYQHQRIRRIGFANSALKLGDHAIVSEDGTEIYVFDENGFHLRTLDTYTNAVLVSFEYADGRLSTITENGGSVTRIEHDSAGNPTAIVAPGGQRTAFTVDDHGYLASVTDPSAVKYQMSCTSLGLLKTFTNPDLHTSTMTYDDRGRLLRDDDALGGFTELARSGDTTDSMITVTQPGGQVQTMETHRLPRNEERRRHTHASGAWEEVFVHSNGSDDYTNSEGTVIQTDYAPDPRWGMGSRYIKSLAMAPPNGTTATITLDRTAVVAEASDPFSLVQMTDQATIDGKTDTTVYDATTRRLTSTTAAGRTNIKTLDANGRVVSQQYDPALSTAITTFAYDSLGRLVNVARGTRSWSYAYDAANQLISRTNANGGKFQYAYNPSGRVTQMTDLNGLQYGLMYGGNQDLVAIALPGAATHQLSYNPFHELASYTPPGNPAYTRSYNPDRSLNSVQLPDGRVRSYSFDTGGRPTQIQYPEATISLIYDSSDEAPHTLLYDRGTPFAAQTLQYEHDGELVRHQQWSGPANATMDYTYAADMQLNTHTFTHGAISVVGAITRDNDGLPTNLGPFTLTRSGPGGMPKLITDAASRWDLSYDNLARVTERRLTFSGLEAFREQYAWDNLDRLTSKIETVKGVAHAYSYVYDAGGRLTQVTRDSASAEQYTYDSRGNRTSSQIGATAATGATYDAQDRLVLLDTTTYQINTCGFLQQRGSDSFQYGARGELVSATLGGQTVQYTYDGFGRRVARSLNGNTTQYVFGNLDNPLQITAVIDTADVVSYFWYDDGGRLLAMERGGVRYTIAADQVGTPRLITDAAGNAVKIMEYDSYGRLTGDSNAGFDFPLGFAAGVRDPLTGMVLLGYRDYDPFAGRWTTRDPALFNGGSLNLYIYCSNDPTSLMDWNGFTSIEASAYDGIGGGIKVAWDKKGFSFCSEVGFGIGSEIEVDPFAGLDKDEVTLIGKLEGKVGALKLGGEVEIHECAKITGKLKACVGPACLSNELKGSLEVDPGHGSDDLKDLMKKTKPKPGGAGAGVEGKIAGKFCFQQAF